MPSAPCAFCGSTGSPSREHVFGQWMSKIGLDLTPVQHSAGPLNGLPRHMGEQPPFRQTVKICAACNNGWMSQLEDVAQRVLTPLILGRPGSVALADQTAITMWAEKTALTAMLLSSESQRASGYGLPPSVYTALYERRNSLRPLDASRFWIGRWDGMAGFSAVRVTPLAVRIPDIPELGVPRGYAMTIVVGELALHGLIFTTLELEVDVTLELGMALLWPSDDQAEWPTGRPCTDESFLRFSDGQMLRSTVDHVAIRP